MCAGILQKGPWVIHQSIRSPEPAQYFLQTRPWILDKSRRGPGGSVLESRKKLYTKGPAFPKNYPTVLERGVF
jgi:hypothetical protein